MPKFQDLAAYAAAIAPVIDAVHVHVHAAARRVRPHPGPSDSLLNDLRFTLPLRPVSRADLAAVHRYGDPAALEERIREHLRRDELAEDSDGRLHPTGRGLRVIHDLYAVHAEAVALIWPGDVRPAAELAGRVLEQAEQAEQAELTERTERGAFAVVTPPYEPDGTPAGVLLFNRITALRHHRADAHAAAWQAAGLTAAEIVALRPGPLREAVEADTNRRAARPYEALSEAERATLHAGLLALA